jgi:Na+-driven multidrug efflux pump
VVLSERIGKHARLRLGRLVTHLLIMAVAVAAVIAGLEVASMGPLSRYLGVDAEAYQSTRWYIWLTLIASIPAAALQMCAQILRSQGHGRLALQVLLAGSATLALADPLLIFGLNLGVVGAGLSLGLSSLVALAVGLVLVQRHIGLSARPISRLLALHVTRVARLALPAMLGNLAMPVGITFLMVTLAGIGASALAGMAVIDRVLQLAYCAFFALPTALVPIIAQNLGARRDDRVRQAIGFTGKLVVLYGVALWLSLLIAAPGIVDYFQLTDAGRSMFLAFSRIGAGVWILFGLDFVAQSLFLTLDRAWWVPAFGWLRGTLGSIPFVYAGAHWQGGTGALLGMWIGNALVAVLAIVTALGVARRYGRTRL